METTVLNARQKLDEACFYLKLMDKIEIERKPLTSGREAEQELSYLLSAFLNACYSCGEHLKQNKGSISKVKECRKKHPEFYESGPDGGWRTTAVHYKPVRPAHDGYFPPPGDNIVFRFRETEPYIPPKAGEPINFNFGPGSFYFSTNSAQNSICDLCALHIESLKKLIELCEQP